jgi:type IV secretory pathway VirB3-like protein
MLTQQNIVARLSVTKDLSMFFAFAVQELKRGGSMMNINLFWEDKGYDPQEIHKL